MQRSRDLPRVSIRQVPSKAERAEGLGRFLKRAAVAREMSPQRLAWLLGRSRTHPYQVFSGRTGLRLATVVEWARVLDIDVGLLACVYARPAGGARMLIPQGTPLEAPLGTPDVHPAAFGAAVRELRLCRRMRQSDLAHVAELEIRHLRRMEAGSVRAPETETAYRLVTGMARGPAAERSSVGRHRELELMAALARVYAGDLARVGVVRR